MFLNHIGTSKSIHNIYYKTIIVITSLFEEIRKKYPDLKNKQKNKTDRAGI